MRRTFSSEMRLYADADTSPNLQRERAWVIPVFLRPAHGTWASVRRPDSDYVERTRSLLVGLAPERGL